MCFNKGFRRDAAGGDARSFYAAALSNLADSVKILGAVRRLFAILPYHQRTAVMLLRLWHRVAAPASIRRSRLLPATLSDLLLTPARTSVRWAFIHPEGFRMALANRPIAKDRAGTNLGERGRGDGLRLPSVLPYWFVPDLWRDASARSGLLHRQARLSVWWRRLVRVGEVVPRLRGLGTASR
jgi:hypothetical protein